MRILAIIFITLFTHLGYSQSTCKPYMPSEKGAKWEITNYSGKGKLVGKTAYELIDKVENGSVINFTAQAISYDKKDKEIFNNTFKAYCKDGKFEFDMAFKMNGASMQAYKDMDVKMDASELEIPSVDQAVGSRLNDGTIKVEVGTGSVPMFTMTVTISDRKVESKEEKPTPAGKFDCIVLTQKMTTKMIMNMENTSKEWYAEGVGMVRSELYNKGGKLTGYSELTKLSK